MDTHAYPKGTFGDTHTHTNVNVNMKAEIAIMSLQNQSEKAAVPATQINREKPKMLHFSEVTTVLDSSSTLRLPRLTARTNLSVQL